MTAAAAAEIAEFPGCLGGLFVVALGVVIVTIVVWVIVSNQRSKAGFLEAAARRLKGTMVPAGLLRHPRVDFSLAGRPARVEFVPAGEDDQGGTRVRVFLKDSPGTLHILPDGFGQSFLKMFGAQDLEIGDRAFDAAYVVKATPESLAAQVFSADRRAKAIAAVRRLEGLTEPRIQLTLDQLRVEVREELGSVEALVRLVKTAEEFLGFLKVAPPVAGIELGPVRIAPGSSCPVCGTALERGIVRCETCQAPHHQECWRYVGQCSIYACSGKRCAGGPVRSHDPGPANV